MIQERVDRASASEVVAPDGVLVGHSLPEHLTKDALITRQDASAKTGAALIVAALPFIGLWLVVRWVWQDIKCIICAIRFFHCAVVEELSSKPTHATEGRRK